jgi:hypothetical protein
LLPVGSLRANKADGWRTQDRREKLAVQSLQQGQVLHRRLGTEVASALEPGSWKVAILTTCCEAQGSENERSEDSPSSGTPFQIQSYNNLFQFQEHAKS